MRSPGYNLKSTTKKLPGLAAAALLKGHHLLPISTTSNCWRFRLGDFGCGFISDYLPSGGISLQNSQIICRPCSR
jgi:hypothetical protein